MARSPRGNFDRAVTRVREDVTDPGVRSALLDFADALDPEIPHESVPNPTPSGGVEHKTLSNGTAALYLGHLRRAHERGLDVLSADTETVNGFMNDIVTDPERRRTGLVEHTGTLSPSSAGALQAAIIGFVRWCNEPGVGDHRPDAGVEWPANGIRVFSPESKAVDLDTLPGGDDLNAMREACLDSMNTRRDRAFVEVVAGTGLRAYAIVTLRIEDVRLDGDIPHVMLNPEIEGDGDKGVIQNSGRWKPIVTDTRPIKEWIDNHPIGDGWLFIGDPNNAATNPSDHWSVGAARAMLKRRAKDAGVSADVNPHAWRHYAYTKSEDLPIPETVRRKVFGWAPGSNVGETTYAHQQNETAGRKFAEAWGEAFADEADSVSISEQILGEALEADLPPEAMKALAQQLVANDEFMDEIEHALHP